MNKLVDNSVIARIHKKLMDLEKEDYTNVEVFLTKNPKLRDDVDTWLGGEKDPDKKQDKWYQKITEVDAWLGKEKRIDIQYMYTRTLQLAKNYKSKKPLFRERPVGTISENDISSIIIRIENLWKDLCFGIYSELEANFSYNSYRKEEKLQNYRGVINWEKTIVNSSSTGGIPLEFVCYTPERTYDTPENLLLMVTLNWLKKDTKTLLEYSGFPKLLVNERNLIQKVFSVVSRIIETTSLQEIREKSSRISKKEFHDDQIKNLIKEVTERINNGHIQDYNYLDLRKWAITYMYFNVEKIHGVPQGVRLDTEQGLFDMYEYFLLYELLAHLENTYQVTCRNLGGKKISFRISKNGKSVRVIFQMNLKKRQLQSKPYMTPDYGIETTTVLPNGNNEIPFIMDAKYWLKRDFNDASNKMLRYIVEMQKENGTEKGILLFPIKKWTGVEPFKEEALDVGHSAVTILSCVICPSEESDKIKDMQKNFDKIYEDYLKPHLE